MKPLFLKASFLLFVYCFCACNNRTDNTELLQQINEGLLQSNKRIRASTDDVLLALKDRVDDLKTTEKAKFIQPKALEIHTLTDSVIRDIENLKTELKQEVSSGKRSTQNFFEEHNRDDRLYSTLQLYKKTVLGLDERLKVEFDNSFFVINKSIDTAEKGKDKFKQILKSSSLPEVDVYLTHILNNVSIGEYKTITFLFQQPIYDHIHYDEFFNAIVTQNAKVLEGGDELEISAGVGSFPYYLKATVKVNGHETPLNEYGIAVRKIKTQKKPGNYSIPIELSFSDPDGKLQTRTVTVNYKTVAVFNTP